MINVVQRLFLIVALLVSPALGQWQLEAVLNGANEVPPVPTMASGYGWFTLNRPANTITYYVSVSGMSGTGAHLHMGAAGVANPAIFIGLSGGPTVWQGTTTALSTNDVITLLNEGLYVNVHSAAFPGGEIRGQLIPVRRTYFVAANINGAQETPPNGSTATGFARVRLNEPENRVIYDVTSTGVVATVAHIHVGAPGVMGPPLVTLSGSSGHWSGVSQVLTASEVSTLKANGMYINIHSAAFPGGEIRGQLIQQTQPFSVKVNGAEETPPNASTVTGVGRLDFDPATNTVSYSISCGTLPSGFLAAHVHRGVIGQAGSVVFALVGTPATGFSGTSAALTSVQVADLFKGNMYVNIHSNAFSGGEIRGQVRPDPYVYGFGGENSTGKTRMDAAGYNGTTSNNVTLILANAVANQSVFVFIAGQNTFLNVVGTPLPFNFPPVGNVWIDIDPAVFLSMTTDGTGGATLVVPVPTDPALNFLTGYIQCASGEPANSAGLSLSDAVEFTIL